jgi:protein-disulfide isomerase
MALLVAASCVIWTSVGRPWWQQRQRSRPPQELVSLAGIPTRGAAPTPGTIGIVEFADYECPSCQQFQRDVLPVIESRFISTDRVSFAFEQFPLEAIHPLAIDAAAIATCSHEAGRFWPVHGQLFQQLSRRTDAEGLLTAVAVDPAVTSAVRACLGGDVRNRIRQRVASAAALGVSVTPTFYLGTIEPGLKMRVRNVFMGSQTATTLESALDVLIRRFVPSQIVTP